MANIITEVDIKTLNQFFKDIVEIKGKLYKEFVICSYNDVCNRYIFRGVPSIEHKLIPSSLRQKKEKDLCILSGYKSPREGIKNKKDQIECEEFVLRKFFSHCDYNGLKVPTIERYRSPPRILCKPRDWLPDDTFELAGLAQHYGLPTRLLDWSYNFYIALYFALRGANKKDKYCSVWALDLSTIKYFGNSNEKVKIITPEYSQNPNLMAQKGVFTLWQISNTDDVNNERPIDRRPLNELIEGHLSSINNIEKKDVSKIFYKINIPIKFKNDLMFFLSTIGHDGSTLFPGYDGVTRSIEEFGMIFSKDKD